MDDIHHAHGMLAERGVEFTAMPHIVAKMRDHELWRADSATPRATRWR